MRLIGGLTLMLMLVSFVAFNAGKMQADRWYNSRFCLLSHETCSDWIMRLSVSETSNNTAAFAIHTSHGKAIFTPIGTINGASAFVQNDGLFCRYFSIGGVNLQVYCVEAANGDSAK